MTNFRKMTVAGLLAVSVLGAVSTSAQAMHREYLKYVMPGDTVMTHWVSPEGQDVTWIYKRDLRDRVLRLSPTGAVQRYETGGMRPQPRITYKDPVTGEWKIYKGRGK